VNVAPGRDRGLEVYFESGLFKPRVNQTVKGKLQIRDGEHLDER